jgi:hypothetical protein
MFRRFHFWYWVLISICVAFNVLLVLFARWLYVR